MVLDAAALALLVDDLKVGAACLESALLLNELEGLGEGIAVWTCFVCVLRPRTLALYSPIVTEV